MAAANWTSVENALQAWVKTATGYDNRHAYWANPNVARPTDGLAFATLEITNRVPIGLAPELLETDHSNDVVVPAAGAEIELEVRQVLDCGFRVQVFAPPARGTKPGTPRGSTNASSLAEKVRLSAALPSIIDALDAVGVSVYELGQVQYVPEVTGTDFEGRAVFEARFYVADSASEFTGFIQTVEVTDTDGKTTTVDLGDAALPDDLPLSF